jgi:hypothetical protein
MQPVHDVARYVHVASDYDAVRAAWERLGFAHVSGWDRGDTVRSTLFRAGPAFVELVDGAALKAEAQPEPRYAAAVAISGR